MAVDKIIPNNLIYTKEKYSYDTIELAKKDLGLEVGNLIRVFGYNTANDGLGASYEVSLTSSGTGIKMDNGYYLVEIPNSNGSKKLDKGAYEGNADSLKTEIDNVNTKVETLIGTSNLERVHKVGHGFTITPVVWINYEWKKNNVQMPAEAIAVRDDDDNFFVLTTGTIVVPDGTVDENGSGLVSNEYYLFSNTVDGGLSLEIPETGIYQVYLQARLRDQQLVADIHLGEPSYVQPTVFNKDTAKAEGFLFDSDIALMYQGGDKKVAAANDTKELNARVSTLEQGGSSTPENVLTHNDVKFGWDGISSDWDVMSAMVLKQDHELLGTTIQKHEFDSLNQSMIGAKFDNNTPQLLYIQDVGIKIEGNVYIDKNTERIYKCLHDTPSVNNDSNFEDISNNGIASSLSSGESNIYSGTVLYDRITWHWTSFPDGTLILTSTAHYEGTDKDDKKIKFPISFYDANYNLISYFVTESYTGYSYYIDRVIKNKDNMKIEFNNSSPDDFYFNFTIIGRWKAYDRLVPTLESDQPMKIIEQGEDLSETDFGYIEMSNSSLIENFDVSMIKTEASTGITINIRRIEPNPYNSNNSIIYFGAKADNTADSAPIYFKYENWEKGWFTIGRQELTVMPGELETNKPGGIPDIKPEG